MTGKPLLSRAEVLESRRLRKAQQSAKRIKKGVKKVNAKRKGQRFPERREPEYLEWLRGQWCMFTEHPLHRGENVCGHWWSRTEAEVMHITSRGAGGTDTDNAVPACHKLHMESHHIGIKSFAAKYGVNLKALARRYTARWLRETGRTV